jgi:hypothetical protein
MQSLKLLLASVHSLEELSNRIIKKSLKIVRRISELADVVHASNPDLSKEQIIDKMIDTTSEWTKTAELVNNEVPNFITETDSSFSLNFEGCPFLAEVWHGDAFDKEGLEGLKMLEADLRKDLAKVSEEGLVGGYAGGNAEN